MERGRGNMIEHSEGEHDESLSSTQEESLSNPSFEELEVLTEIPEFSKNGRPIGERYRAFAALRQGGFTQAAAARVLGLCRASGTKIERKLGGRYDLTSSKHVKQAVRAHEKLINAFLHPEKNDIPIDLKGTDVNKAIDRVVDRAQPLPGKGENDLPEPVQFIQINLDAYK